MINPEIKSKINKIDFELKEVFENVFIKEKFYKTGFFEIICNKVQLVRESKDYKRVEVKVIINQPDLLSEMVKWSYSTNPLDESALWIDRVSSIEDISKDIITIAEECRYDESYLMNLEPLVDVINESVMIEEEVPSTTISLATNVLKDFKIDVLSTNQETKLTNESFNFDPSDRVVKFYHNSDIKISDMFKIESKIQSLDGVNWVVFKEGFVEVNFTPNF